MSDLYVSATRQAAAKARMVELGGGVGKLGLHHPEMFEDMLAWDDLSENDHADTVLGLLSENADLRAKLAAVEALVGPVVLNANGRFGTHSIGCEQWHANCLGQRVLAAIRSQEPPTGETKP